jgi:hypothetical protein
MAILSKGTDFSTGDQVTAAKLDALVDSATFASGAVDDVSTALDGSSPKRIIVKDGGIGTQKLPDSSSTTTGVTFAKMQHAPANTVLVRDSDSEGDISAKAVTDTQILIGDGTGFTAAALSGNATMTNAGVVTVGSVSAGATGSTATAGDSSTKLATTAFVDAATAITTPTIISMTTPFTVTGSQGLQNIPNASITSGSDIVSSGTNTFTIKAGLYFFNIANSLGGDDNGSSVRPEFNISASSGTMALSYQLVGSSSTGQEGTPVYIASDTALTIQVRQQNTSGSFDATINSYTLTLFRVR